MTEVASGENIDHNFGEIQVWNASGAPPVRPYTRIGLVSVKEFELSPRHVVAVKNRVALFWTPVVQPSYASGTGVD
jgi:hypothetical protein